MSTPAHLVRLAFGWTLTVLLMAAPLFAQGEEEFKLAGPDDIIREELPATPLVFAAYAAVWVVLIIYVFSIWRRVSKVERELNEVSSRLQAR
jgi:CcmD family protein